MSTVTAARALGRDRLIEQFIPRADHGGRHETLIRAPADPVFEVAWSTDMQEHPLARGVFWLRAKLLRAKPAPRAAHGLVEETMALGWAMLAHRPGRELVMGAVTRPWEANVVFRPLSSEEFARFAEPGLVKIAWTIEAEPLGPALTRFRTETRVVATDEAARRRFRRYWRFFGSGILLIRLLLLPRLRRDAERRYRMAELERTRRHELEPSRTTPAARSERHPPGEHDEQKDEVAQ